MKNVDVLVVIDTLSTIKSGNLQDNVYLFDTNKYAGSWNEGNCELETVCHDTQVIRWKIISVTPKMHVEITGFRGNMIDTNICIPTKVGINENVYWEGTVETKGYSGQYRYTVDIFLDGKLLSFDPFINVQ